MLSKSGDKSCGNLKRRLSRLFSSSKMTGSGPTALWSSGSVSTYERMDNDKKKMRLSEEAEDIKMDKKRKMKLSEKMEDKENNNLKDKNNKKQKKKRSWKRFRAVALTTCRYIGMGVAHMSPATVHSAPDYYMDPQQWNKSFSSSYNKSSYNSPSHNKAHHVGPHWTNSMVFTAGW